MAKLNMAEGAKHRDIKLPDLLKEKYIELDLKEKEKTKLIAELVDIVVKSNRIKDKKALFKAILEREIRLNRYRKRSSHTSCKN